MATRAKTSEVTELKKINRRLLTVRLVGISPLIQHRWSEKAKGMMRAKQQEGKKTKVRDLRDPEAEAIEAGYYCDKEKKVPGVLAVAIKAAIISAAHNDLGMPKTLVRKALFIYPMGREVVIPLEKVSGKGPAKREVGTEFLPVGKDRAVSTFEEDMVRVGQGSADLRYRPYFYDWAVTTRWEVDADLLKVDDLLTLLDRAGFGVGIHEWRPEKGGEYGRFRIDTKFKITDEAIA